MMLAHMVPGERIQLLSLPRDLMVDIEGHGTNRINASFWTVPVSAQIVTLTMIL